MEKIIALCGFVGGWLLVAGPIHQAVLELREEDFARDRIRETASKVVAPDKVSVWWWLVPPIKIVLERRRTAEYRHNYLAALSKQDSEALFSYMSKATGWMMVATGGSLIALKETYELLEVFEIHDWLAFPLGAVMFLASVSLTISLSRRQQSILSNKQ